MKLHVGDTLYTVDLSRALPERSPLIPYQVVKLNGYLPTGRQEVSASRTPGMPPCCTIQTGSRESVDSPDTFTPCGFTALGWTGERPVRLCQAYYTFEQARKYVFRSRVISIFTARGWVMDVIELLERLHPMTLVSVAGDLGIDITQAVQEWGALKPVVWPEIPQVADGQLLR